MHVPGGQARLLQLGLLLRVLPLKPAILSL